MYNMVQVHNTYCTPYTIYGMHSATWMAQEKKAGTKVCSNIIAIQILLLNCKARQVIVLRFHVAFVHVYIILYIHPSQPETL